MFTGNTRLPMVAGWDGLLPAWFTTLHQRYQTPVNSIVFVGAMTFAFSLAGLVGVGREEAFQLLWNASAIFYGLTYLVMFAIPIAGLRGSEERTPLWIRIAAASGFLMTLLYVTLSVLPIVIVSSRLVFALKICGLIAVTNAIGLALYMRSASLADRTVALISETP
jgi:amino acid transporter